MRCPECGLKMWVYSTKGMSRYRKCQRGHLTATVEISAEEFRRLTGLRRSLEAALADSCEPNQSLLVVNAGPTAAVRTPATIAGADESPTGSALNVPVPASCQKTGHFKDSSPARGLP